MSMSYLHILQAIWWWCKLPMWVLCW